MSNVDEQRRAALTLLARREFSRVELRQRLTRKVARRDSQGAESQQRDEDSSGGVSRVDGDSQNASDSLDTGHSQNAEPLGTSGTRLDGAAGEDIDELLDDLESQGHLNDARFVESFVRGRLRRGQGSLRIRHDLVARGVDAELIDQHLTFTTEFWITRVQAIRARRFTEALPVNAADRARQARFLAQRGFPSDVIFAAFKRS